MKAMILAAGLGKRMQPLTNSRPKPLLDVAGRYLIEYHLEKLAKAGIRDVVINTHWLAEQLPRALGAGEKWGLNIVYSHEPELLETAGGIRQALKHLVNDHSDTFLLINGDVFFDWDLSNWIQKACECLQDKHAFLALVPNPLHHKQGDFSCDDNSHFLSLHDASNLPVYTYSGMGLYRASLFSDLKPGYQALGPILKQAIANKLILGQLEEAYWLDVGTPERLAQLKHHISSRKT